MNAQASLFDAPSHGGYRHDGPRSSVDAARSMSGDVLTKQQMSVLAVVASNWCPDSQAYNATAYEIGVKLGRQQNVMSRRLFELRGEDADKRLPELVRRIFNEQGEPLQRVGSSRRMCDVHEATPLGLEWLSGLVDVATGERL